MYPQNVVQAAHVENLFHGGAERADRELGVARLCSPRCLQHGAQAGA